MEVLLCQDKDLLQGQLSLLVPGNCFHHLVILNICKGCTGVSRVGGTAASWATLGQDFVIQNPSAEMWGEILGEEAQPPRQPPQNALIPPHTSSALGLENYSSGSSRNSPFLRKHPQFCTEIRAFSILHCRDQSFLPGGSKSGSALTKMCLKPLQRDG